MRKPQWNSEKGIRLFRCGGLSAVKQTNSKAPIRYGLWAFVWPYFEWFYLGGDCSRSKFPKKEMSKRQKHKIIHPRAFWYKGPIFTCLNVPGSIQWNGGHAGAIGGLNWFLTSDKELFRHLGKVHAQDIADYRKANHQISPQWWEKFGRSECNQNRTFNCGDHYEVFIPRGLIR